MHSRRDFLGAAAVVAAAGAAAPAVAADGPPARGASPYDFAAVEAALSKPFRHRQVFDADRLANGTVAHFILNSLNAYQFDYAEGPGTYHAVGVFHGTAVTMLLDDAMWEKYELATVSQRRGEPVKHAGTGNPYLRATSPLDPNAARDDLRGLYHDQSLTALAQRGTTYLACDNAMRGLATDLVATYAVSSDPVQMVHADLRKHLVLATLLVPAGVAAINQAQEMRYTLFSAS